MCFFFVCLHHPCNRFLVLTHRTFYTNLFLRNLRYKSHVLAICILILVGFNVGNGCPGFKYRYYVGSTGDAGSLANSISLCTVGVQIGNHPPSSPLQIKNGQSLPVLVVSYVRSLMLQRQQYMHVPFCTMPWKPYQHATLFCSSLQS